MKKAIILITGLTGLTIAANAQKLAASKVPMPVKVSFTKAHPDVKTVTWEKEKNNFEAGFTSNNEKASEVYTTTGKLVESEISIKPTDLPTPVTTYIAAHYKGVKVKEAAKITKVDGTLNYEAVINGKDVLFDAKGNPQK